MQKIKQYAALIFSILSVVTFWVPPVGLIFSLVGTILSLQKFSERLRFSRLALGLSILGAVLFIAFWTTVWALSQ